VDRNQQQRLRDDLISKALYGKITPQQAEEEAHSAGLAPLAFRPAAGKFDPMKESRWTLLQAIAWIAWRDLDLVMEQDPRYRSESTRWSFCRWQVPPPQGEDPQIWDGWVLNSWGPSNSLLLTLEDQHMRADGDLPKTACVTPRESEGKLWRALLAGHLKAEGFDRSGRLNEIPAREWAHLKLIDDRNDQLLKYEALDREVFSKVRLSRDEIRQLWPRYEVVDPGALNLGNMTDLPLGLMLSETSYVPLSLAVCWIATGCGIKQVAIQDEESWKSAVGRILPKLSDGSVEVIGCSQDQLSEQLPRTAFGLVDVSFPLSESLSDILVEKTHLRCCFYVDAERWKEGYCDQFLVAGSLRPRWTHLQVARAAVLKFWPKPPASSKSGGDCLRWLVDKMRGSPEKRPRPKAEYKKEALKTFSRLSARQFEILWPQAIRLTGAEAWSKAGRPRQKIKSPRQGKS
jgi:hypothetical protein